MNFAELQPELEAAFDEVARNALGQEAIGAATRHADPKTSYQGAYLALLSPVGALQLGIASDERGVQRLAKALMMMDPGEPDLSAAEMADAVNEIVNIVAGAFKGRLLDRINPIQMGLPVFFRGPAQPTDHTAVLVSDLTMGDVEVALLLVYPRGNGKG